MTRDWFSPPRAGTKAYVTVIDGAGFEGMHWRLGIAEFGIGGFTPLQEWYRTRDEGQRDCDARNELLGLDKEDALIIKTSSMRSPGGRVSRWRE